MPGVPITNSFVCLDDVLKHFCEMNTVIYNPTKHDFKYRKALLKQAIKTSCRRELTDAQLNSLCNYDEHHLDDFVLALQEILEIKK